MTNQAVIRVDHLRKVYGATVAVEDISFEIYAGEIFGMVGPNGAGKTTTTECIEGLRRPDGGAIQVFDMNPQKDAYALRERIGVQLQTSALQDRLKVWEALDLFASFYAKPVDPKQLLAQMGLAEKRNDKFAKLSGGQKQRLFIALALINDPELVFLDELTTGLDPQARHAMWDMVRGIRERGKTVFLTTHFMEEAERLCDRVAIVDHGKIVALDTPQNLIRQLGAENRLIFSIDGKLDLQKLQRLAGVTRVEPENDEFIVTGRGERLVGDVVHEITANGARLRTLRTEQPTLEEVFLKLTGRKMRE